MPNRRILLKGMGGVALATATPSVVAASQMRDRVLLAPSYVVNLPDTGLLDEAGPSAGDTLALIRDPHRRFDANSIGVHFRGERIGYLPGNQSRLLAPMIDAGFELEASVTDVRHLPRQAVSLELYILRA